jgi:hypothetical protein
MYDGGTESDVTVAWNPAQNRRAITLLEGFQRSIELVHLENVSPEGISQQNERAHRLIVAVQNAARDQVGQYGDTDRNLSPGELVGLRQQSEALELKARKIKDNLLAQALVVPDYQTEDGNLSRQEETAYRLWDKFRLDM